MMDWYVIEYLYPNALKEFSRTMFPNVCLPCLSILSYYDVKKLYKFFDKLGIYLTVEMYTKNNWVYSISLTDTKGYLNSSGESKTNREDIEIEGFYECFRILEKKLEKTYNYG